MTRHELYTAIQNATGTYYRADERPLQFDAHVIGDLGEIWEYNTNSAFITLQRMIAATKTEINKKD